MQGEAKPSYSCALKIVEDRAWSRLLRRLLKAPLQLLGESPSAWTLVHSARLEAGISSACVCVQA